MAGVANAEPVAPMVREAAADVEANVVTVDREEFHKTAAALWQATARCRDASGRPVIKQDLRYANALAAIRGALSVMFDAPVQIEGESQGIYGIPQEKAP